MVTTRSGSRAASESLSTPAKTASALPDIGDVVRDTPVSRAARALFKPAPAAAAAAGPSARRRAKQKDRVRALRAAAGVKEVKVAEVEPELATSLRETIRALLGAIDEDDDICLTRAPRAVSAEDESKYPDWKSLLGATRAVVKEGVAEGVYTVSRNGLDVPAGVPLEGPMRVGRGDKF